MMGTGVNLGSNRKYGKQIERLNPVPWVAQTSYCAEEIDLALVVVTEMKHWSFHPTGHWILGGH